MQERQYCPVLYLHTVLFYTCVHGNVIFRIDFGRLPSALHQDLLAPCGSRLPSAVHVCIGQFSGQHLHADQHHLFYLVRLKTAIKEGESEAHDCSHARSTGIRIVDNSAHTKNNLIKISKQSTFTKRRIQPTLHTVRANLRVIKPKGIGESKITFLFKFE
jgi:hypothetical protein